MNEIDKLRKRAGIIEDHRTGGVGPIEDIVYAFIHEDADSETLMNSILKLTGNDPKKIVVHAMLIADQLARMPNPDATKKFISKLHYNK